MVHQKSHIPYVLITPACNEEKLIEYTLKSVVKQTVPPVKWVIVNDGSTDATARIVSRYLEKNPWIKLVNLPQRRERHFAAKVHAFNAGRERLQNVGYELIGNLDGDISFDADHFGFLLGKLKADPKLGVAGTIFREENYSSETDSFEGQNHVAGQVVGAIVYFFTACARKNPFEALPYYISTISQAFQPKGNPPQRPPQPQQPSPMYYPDYQEGYQAQHLPVVPTISVEEEPPYHPHAEYEQPRATYPEMPTQQH